MNSYHLNYARLCQLAAATFCVFMTTSNAADACDLSVAKELTKLNLKKLTLKVIPAVERRSTNAGEWKIYSNGKKVIAIQREDNNEWGTISTTYLKVQDGFVASLTSQHLYVDENTPESTTDYIFECRKKIGFSYPMAFWLKKNNTRQNTKKYVEEVMATLVKSKELNDYLKRMSQFQ